ncbi:succinate dehydrogenase iron-sulfur subunit [Desulfonispora thiosulfatigenes]|nr:succinate dehydrogenase iron-sulfur subunit [Desulfonispora thiosulfatigenes]
MKTVHLKIKRQDSPETKPYWEEFKVPQSSNMNVISCLMAIQKNPVNLKGEKTTPVVWESNCLEEVCGACSMIVNGKARQSCTALVEQLTQPITLEPLNKFKIIRDLYVDRAPIFDALKRVRAWISIDGTYDLGPGPKQNSKQQEVTYNLSRCMSCGVCAQSCPNYSEKTDFIGPAAVAQAHLASLHPTGHIEKEERIAALIQPGGIQECGNSQNCVRECPKQIPLTASLAELKKEVTKHAIKSIFRSN